MQSRLPDPAWLERWLDQQIQFDATWEKRVVGDDPAQPVVAVRRRRSSPCSSSTASASRSPPPEPLPAARRRARSRDHRRMWTAVALWRSSIAGRRRLRGVGAARASRGGASPWPFVVGVPLVYFALIPSFTLRSTSRSPGCWSRAAAAPTCGSAPRRALRLFWREFAAMAGSVPRMIFYRLADARSAAARRRRCRCCCCTACCAMPACGRLRALPREARRRPGLHAVLRPAARVDRHVRRPGRGEDRRDPRGDRRAEGRRSSRTAWAGSSRAPICARYGGAQGAPRRSRIGTPHHGSVHAWLFPAAASRRCGRATRGSPSCNRATARRAAPPIVSLWSWHDSMVAPQTSSCLDGAENIALIGIGHNALRRRTTRSLARIVDELRRADGARAERIAA